MPTPAEVQKLIEGAGGKLEEIAGPLLDGSGFAIASFPLPEDHWTKTMKSLGLEPPMPLRIGTGPERDKLAQQIREAGKYAYIVTGITDLGDDHDADAFLQNLVVGLLGYWTADGKSST